MFSDIIYNIRKQISGHLGPGGTLGTKNVLDLNYSAGYSSQMVRICLQCWKHGFNPWVRKIPWRRAWQPTPVFLPGESHEQRSLEGYILSGCKEWDTMEWPTVSVSHGCMYSGEKWMYAKGNFIRCKLNLNGIYFFDRPTRFHMFCCWLGSSQFKVSLCWKSIDFLNSWTFPRLTSWLSSGRMRTFHASYSICWESLLYVSFPYVYFQLYRSAIFSHSQLRQLWCLVLEIPAVPNCW